MQYVLDACALLAFLRGEEGAEKIETLLLEIEIMFFR
jgi:PIN domain nuclease of toxin-antitoxin system